MGLRLGGDGWRSAILTAAYRLLAATWRYRHIDRAVFDDALAAGPAVFAFWHGEQLPLIAHHASPGIAGLASQSADGSLLAGVIQRLGYAVFRGSSSRGAVGALRRGIALIEAGYSPALAIDGPRGPFREPQPGAVGLAVRTGRPVVFVVSRVSPALRLPTWDRFVLPLPGARIEVAYGRYDVSGQSVDDAVAGLRNRMQTLTDRISRPSSPRPLAG